MQTKMERPIAHYSSFLYFTNDEKSDETSGGQCTPKSGQIASALYRTITNSEGIEEAAMSSVVEGPPESKRLRIEMNTQASIDSPSVSCSVAGEASQDGQSPAAPSSASYRSSNSSVVSSSESPIKEEDTSELLNDESEGSTVAGSTTSALVNNSEILEMLKTFGGVFGQCDLEGMMRAPPSGVSLMAPPSPPASAGIPGALAVAQTPAAQLFADDDWSWHRNPAASIRSGGTNKQTPVWKYFVYNKAENLSRCIVGDCTYMLKGPHTSTLACHLKKHTREYLEFQKLKQEYSRTKLETQPKEGSGSPGILPPSSQNQNSHPLQNLNLNLNLKRQAPSPTSSSSGCGGSSGVGIDLSVKKAPKKEMKLNDMFLNGFRQATGSAAQKTSTNTNPVPSFVTNMMLQMNPLQMLLAQSQSQVQAQAQGQAQAPTHPQPISTPTSSAPTLNVSVLQQAGLSLAANGQIIQSKKWRMDDKKQRELGAKLSLALATSHIPFEVLQNPLWKDVFELAQPKFTIAPDQQSHDQVVNATWHKVHQSIKSQLGQLKKLNLLLDVTKISADISRVTVAAAIAAGNSYDTQVILLAFRNISSVSQADENPAEDVANAFEKVLSEFKISEESINRVICSGLNGFVGEDAGNIITKQMDSFSSKLSTAFATWLETTPTLEITKKSIYSMLLSYLTVPTAIPMACQMIKGKFELPVTEPIQAIIEHLMTHREVYQMSLDGLAPITDREWGKVTGVHHVLTLLKPLMRYTCEMTTIDTVIPTIMQIRNVLEKDIYHLGDVGVDLLDTLKATWQCVTDPYHEDFDSTYIQATALNPQLAVTLNSEQIGIAKSLIESEVSKRTRRASSAAASKSKSNGNGGQKKLAMGVDSLLANVFKNGAGAGGTEDAFALYGDLLQSMKGDGAATTASESEENIVNQYFEEISSSIPVDSIFTQSLRMFGNPMQAPLAYWKSCSARCAQLADFATELLSIPIFTLTAERVLAFSTAASTNSNLNSNLILTNLDSVEQLEKQLLLRFNRQIVAKVCP